MWGNNTINTYYCWVGLNCLTCIFDLNGHFCTHCIGKCFCQKFVLQKNKKLYLGLKITCYGIVPSVALPVILLTWFNVSSHFSLLLQGSSSSLDWHVFSVPTWSISINLFCSSYDHCNKIASYIVNYYQLLNPQDYKQVLHSHLPIDMLFHHTNT